MTTTLAKTLHHLFPKKLTLKHVKIGLLWVGAILMLLPFWVMVATSLVDLETVWQSTDPIWFPWPMRWENYGNLFQQVAMGQYLFNSIVVALVTTVAHVLLSAMAAYAFSRMRFPGRELLFFAFLITLMIPPQVNIVPLFFLMKTFHWIDTYWGLIVPGVFGAFGVFLCRQWFQGLPKDLEEASFLDGCNPWQTFWHVVLPLSKPPLVALGLFVFITSWNSFMWPLIVTYSDHMRTLPLGLAALKETFRDTINWPMLMAASTVTVIPVVALFLVGQKQFIQGILKGGVKG